MTFTWYQLASAALACILAGHLVGLALPQPEPSGDNDCNGHEACEVYRNSSARVAAVAHTTISIAEPLALAYSELVNDVMEATDLEALKNQAMSSAIAMAGIVDGAESACEEGEG